MRALNRCFSRIWNFATRRRSDERLREELDQHVALQTEENVRLGMSPQEARRQALLKLGAIEAIRERYREETACLCSNVCNRMFALPCVSCENPQASRRCLC